MKLSRCACALLLALCSLTPAKLLFADEPPSDEPSPEAIKLFETKIRPLLVEHCSKCHGEKQQKGQLRLDSLESALKGGETGPAIVRGKPHESVLIDAINYRGPEMPPDGKLSDDKIELLTAWIRSGAPWPADKIKVRSKSEGPSITDEDRAFWSFQPVRDSAPPEIADPAWAKNGIDRFIRHKLQSEGMTPSPEAGRRTLIRRLYFDLTGLPPTPEEIAAFEADESPTAYEELVDRLLASPRYGERWGRHWLDLARYGESNGNGMDQYRPNAWRYRDYVVRAFNEDKPYDRFILEQLAGDEVAPNDAEAITATGFLRHWTYESNQLKTREVRDVWLTDLTDVTGDVFLGMGLQCARCHDHKFDPILQKDYYRIQSFFAGLIPRDDISIATASERAEIEARLNVWNGKTSDLRTELTALQKPLLEERRRIQFGMYPQEIKDMYRKPAAERDPLEDLLVAFVEQHLRTGRGGANLGRHTPEVRARMEELEKKMIEVAGEHPEGLPFAMTVIDNGPKAPTTTLPGKDEPIEPGFLAVIDPTPADVQVPTAAPQSTGRRTALARWITSPNNPLTARVMVNRLWQYHFGRGIAAATSDFGRLGERPTHPELLDWLATRFVEGGWRIKAMHRLIVTSATYRQSAVVPTTEMATRKDPANTWLWRANIRRLQSEPIFDSMLSAGDDLNLQMGGPSVESTEGRRTVYNKIVRNQPDPLLRAFDAPDGFISIPLRDESTTVTQALMLINGEWSLDRAKGLARRLQRERSLNAPDELAIRATRLVFGRDPEENELAEAVEFLKRKSATEDSKEGQPSKETNRPTLVSWEALVDYCHVLLNSNEFLYVD